MAKRYYKAETYEARKSIGYLIRRSRNLITQRMETLFCESSVAGGFTLAQWAVLMCLRDNIARTPAELCHQMCYDSGALTRLLDHMEESRLIRRRRSVKDRRVVRLSLTAEGRKLIGSMMGHVVGFYNDLLSNFTVKEAETLVVLLTRLIGNLSQKPGKG